MVYRIELNDTSRELRKGMLQAMAPVCAVAALIALVVSFGLFYLIGTDVPWWVYIAPAILAPGLILAITFCSRTDYARDLVCFYTVTEKGLLMENEEAIAFIPWKGIRSLRMLSAGLLIVNTDGLSVVYAMGNLAPEKRREFLEYAQQQVRAKAEVVPVQPPSWAISDTPLICEPSQKSARQTADEMVRKLAPRLALVRLVILGVLVLCTGALGLVAAADVPYGLLLVLVVYCMWMQMRRVFHPGNRLMMKTLAKRRMESHVTPGSWLVRHADGTGAWGITKLTPDEIAVRRGKGVLLFCLKNRSVIAVDENQTLPDWLPTPVQTIGTPAFWRVFTLLSPVVAALLFWGSYHFANERIGSADDECDETQLTLMLQDAIRNALLQPTPEQAARLAIFPGASAFSQDQCSLNRQPDGSWMLRVEFTEPVDRVKNIIYIIDEEGKLIDFRSE